jgi:glucarate dehydratase
VKIKDLKVTPVAIADPPLRSSFGRHAPYALRLVIELTSEDGITGIAEAHGGEQALLDFHRARDLVIGRSVFDLARLRQDLMARADPVQPDEPADDAAMAQGGRIDVPIRVFAALEVAALDLIAMAWEVPVCELLGGRVRETVPFAAYLFYKHAGGGGAEWDEPRKDPWNEALTPETLVAQAKQMVAEYGFKSLKLKAGVLPPEDEIATIRALHEAFGPDVPLRIDPNCAWTVETSIRVGEALADSLEYLEDPTPTIAGMAAVRRGLLERGIDLPLASNMAVMSFADAAEAVRTDAAQVILGDHHYWGGLRAIIQLGQLCESFGLGLSMHSNSHLGISLMAMVHVAAATPQLTYACDTHYPWQDAADEIVASGRVPIRHGEIQVPVIPGLGVELDRDALARGKERYEKCGLRIRDDVAEMRQHVDPAWERVIPRW